MFVIFTTQAPLDRNLKANSTTTTDQNGLYSEEFLA